MILATLEDKMAVERLVATLSKIARGWPHDNAPYGGELCQRWARETFTALGLAWPTLAEDGEQ